MRYRNCDCICPHCETGPGHPCYPTADKTIADGIFLGGEENGVFKLVIRRLITYRGNMVQPYFSYFTICIPMSGNIGSYHFTGTESPVDCYAYIKKQTCTDSFGLSGTQYFFWIGLTSGMTEIPTSSVDKTNYLPIYTDITNTPVYYLVRFFGGIYLTEPLNTTYNWVIPSGINQNLPYVFWASPAVYQVDLTFEEGGYRAGWCNYLGQRIQGAEMDYSDFNGTYIMPRNIFPSTNLYFGATEYENGDDRPIVGNYAECRSWPAYFQLNNISMLFDIIGDARGWTVTFIPTTPPPFISGIGTPSWRIFNKNFELDTDGTQPLPCVDTKLLTGEYGEYTAGTHSEDDISCDPNAIYNGRCSFWQEWDVMEATVEAKVLEWGLHYGCF